MTNCENHIFIYYLDRAICGLFIAFTIGLITASSGVAYSSTFFWLLFFSSLIKLVVRWPTKYFLSFERIGLVLYFYLLTAALLKNEGANWFLFVALEYKELAVAPIIAMALSEVLTIQKLRDCILVGFLFNLFGAIFIAFKYYQIALLEEIPVFLGLNYDKNHLIMNGKFVQTWIILFIPVVFFVLEEFGSKVRSGVIFVFSSLFFQLYNWFLMGSKSLGTISVLLFFLMGLAILVCKYNRHYVYRFVLLGLIWVFSIIVWQFGQDVYTWWHQVSNFPDPRIPHVQIDSISQRLVVWQGVMGMDIDRLLFGEIGGSLDAVMQVWFEEGGLTREMLEWRDFHSEMIWLIVLGGVGSVLLYIWFIGLLCLNFMKMMFQRRQILLGIFYAGILAGLFWGYGMFNSIFTPIRESYMACLVLIISGYFVRRDSKKDINF